MAPQESTDTRFLLGLGCQKGGTSWLYHYLSCHPNVDMGMLKEYHVLDLLYIPEFRKKYTALLEEERQIQCDQLNANHEIAKRIDFVKNVDNYFDYFTNICKRNPNVFLTGDITPSYSALSKNTLQFVKNQLIARNFAPRLVFIMRDPLERCWSAVRMSRRAIGANPQSAESARAEEQAVIQYAKSRACEIRTSYNVTCERVMEVFSNDEFFFAFYEDFFSPSEIQRLAAFLEIKHTEPNLRTKKNASEKTSVLSNAAQMFIVNQYQHIYRWAIDTWGQDKIVKIWPSAQLYLNTTDF